MGSVLCASTILNLNEPWQTYETRFLPVNDLMQWVKNGCQFGDSQTLNSTMVLNEEEQQYAPSNTALEFLLRGRNTKRLGSYAFFSFYEKRSMKHSEQEKQGHVGRPRNPRDKLHKEHPQSCAYELMRVMPPRVPNIGTRIPQRPAGWLSEEDADDDASGTEDADTDRWAEERNEYASFVLALFYPLHAKGRLPLRRGESLWEFCHRWWRENADAFSENGAQAWIPRVLNNIHAVRNAQTEKARRARARPQPGDEENEEDPGVPRNRHRQAQQQDEDGNDEDQDDPYPAQKRTLAGAAEKGVLRAMFQNIEPNGQLANPVLRKYEQDTQELLFQGRVSDMQQTRASAEQGPLERLRRLQRTPNAKQLTEWEKQLRNYKRNEQNDTGAEAGLHAAPGITVATTVPQAQAQAPHTQQLYSQGRPVGEPEWNRAPGTAPPTISDAIHAWQLGKAPAQAFSIWATAFLKKARGTIPGTGPVLERDSQVRLLVNGEAGTGKSRVALAMCWFATMHERNKELVVTSHQGRPVANLRNPGVTGMTSSHLAAVDSVNNDRLRRDADNVNGMQQRYAPLSGILIDEASLMSLEHLNAINRQSTYALGERAAQDAPFGGLDVIMFMDVLQHKPVNGAPMTDALGGNPFQNARAQLNKNSNRVLKTTAGAAVLKQFDQAVMLTEQKRQTGVEGAEELHSLLKRIRNENPLSEDLFETLNKRALGQPGMPANLGSAGMQNARILVSRNSLIPMMCAALVPKQAKAERKRLVKCCAVHSAETTERTYLKLPKPLEQVAAERPMKSKCRITPPPPQKKNYKKTLRHACR